MTRHARGCEHSTRPVDPQTGCLLFSIPAELRNQVYHDLFFLQTQPGLTEMVHENACSNRPTVLSLLQTCRLIKQEAESTFYAINHLMISVHDLPQIIRDVSFDRLQHIHYLRISSVQYIEGISKALRPLVRLQGMKHFMLIISVLDWTMDQSKYERELLFLRKVALRLPHVYQIQLIAHDNEEDVQVKQLELAFQGWIEEARQVGRRKKYAEMVEEDNSNDGMITRVG